jgi:hypothetical protein
MINILLNNYGKKSLLINLKSTNIKIINAGTNSDFLEAQI